MSITLALKVNLTTKEKSVLRALISKELSDISEIDEEDFIVNSPVLSSVYRGEEEDLSFIKTKNEYEQFLGKLLRKL